MHRPSRYCHINLQMLLPKQVTLPYKFLLANSSTSPLLGGHFEVPGCSPDRNGCGSNATGCDDGVSKNRTNHEHVGNQNGSALKIGGDLLKSLDPNVGKSSKSSYSPAGSIGSLGSAPAADVSDIGQRARAGASRLSAWPAARRQAPAQAIMAALSVQRLGGGAWNV